MHADASVVFDQAQLAKAIHEEANAGSGRTDHFREGLLCDRRNQCLWFARPSIFRHEEENSGQTPFAGVEELIDKVGLSSHAACEQKLQEQVGESMLRMHDADHLLTVNLQRIACCNGS